VENRTGHSRVVAW